METIKSEAKLEVSITIKLTEKEARALDGFAYFGAYKETMEFVHKTWHNKINQEDLKQLFDTVHASIYPHLEKIDKAKQILK